MLEVAEARERGRLVDDRVRPRTCDGLEDGLAVEQVEHDAARAVLGQAIRLRL